MLQKLRNYIKGWVAFLIFTLISLTFVLWGVQSYLQSRHRKPGSIAKVYDKVIMSTDVNNIVQKNGVDTNAALRQLINQTVLQHFFPNVSANVLGNSIYNTGFILPKDKQYFYNIVKNYSAFDYIKFNSSLFAEAASKAIDQDKNLDNEMKQYYAEHKKDFYSLEERNYEYVLLDNANYIKSNIKKPTAEEIQAYYDDNRSAFPNSQESWSFQRLYAAAADKAKADDLIKQLNVIKSGDDFDKFYAKHKGIIWKHDEQSANDISKFEGLKNLKKIGEVSKPKYYSNIGYVFIFKLESHHQPVLKPNKADKDSIIKIIMDNESMQLTAQLNQTIKDIKLRNPSSLEAMRSGLSYKLHKLSIQTTGFKSTQAFAKDKVKIIGNKDVKDYIDKNKTDLKNGQVVGPIHFKYKNKAAQLATDADFEILILRMKGVHVAKLLPFKAVKQKVKQALVSQKERSLADAFIVNAKQLVAKGHALASIEYNDSGFKVVTYKNTGKNTGWSKRLFAQAYDVPLQSLVTLPENIGGVDGSTFLYNLLKISAKDKLGSFKVGSDNYLLQLHPTSDEDLSKLQAGVDKWLDKDLGATFKGHQLKGIFDSMVFTAKSGDHIKVYDN